MKLVFSKHIFEKNKNIKFYENSSSGSRFVQFGQTHRQRDITRLIVALRNFVIAHKNVEKFVINKLQDSIHVFSRCNLL